MKFYANWYDFLYLCLKINIYMSPTKITPQITSSREEPTITDSRTIVNRHLSNINDKISEDDIRNVEPNLNINRDNENEYDDPSEIKDLNDDFNVAKQLPTAWNLRD